MSRVRIAISYDSEFAINGDPDMSVRFETGPFVGHDLHVTECDAIAVLEIMREYADLTALRDLGGRPWTADENSLD